MKLSHLFKVILVVAVLAQAVWFLNWQKEQTNCQPIDGTTYCVEHFSK